MVTEVKDKIKVTVYRFNPLKDKEPRYVTYEVPYTPYMTVLSALNYIYENIDSSLSYQYSCREGLCHACDMIVNGEAVEACSKMVHGDITIEPPWKLGFKVIKDLIADDVRLSERDHILSASEQTFKSIELLAKAPTLDHAVIKYLKSIGGERLSEEEVSRELGIPSEKLKEILNKFKDRRVGSKEKA